MIKIEDVSITFGSKKVLDQLSLTMQEGEIIGLVAPNGTGKSTLLNVIMNYVPAASGKITVDHFQYTSIKNEQQIHRLVTMMPDQNDLYNYLSGVDHLKIYQKMWHESSLPIEEVIQALHMEHYIQQKVGSYSLGMRQRLCFAMQIVANTKYMLMDELMNGLDPTNVELISTLLVQKKQEGKAILIASHLLENLAQYADRVFFLKNGTFVHEMTQTQPKEKIIKFKAALTTTDFEETLNILPNGTNYFNVHSEAAQAKIMSLLKENNIEEFSVTHLNLADYYSLYFEQGNNL